MTFLRKLIQPSFKAGYARSSSESANPNLWDGLVGAWMPSMGVTGETLRDVSGNGNHGTLTGMDAASDWVATSKGLALDFDGFDDYVDCGRPSMGVGKLTVNAWIKLNAGNIFQHLVDSSSNSWHLALLNNNKPYFYNGATLHTLTETLSTNTWYMITGVQGSTLDLHVNGVLSQSISSNVNLTTNNIHIGRWQNGGRNFNGRMANISIYNRALSPDEIQTLYVDSLAPFRKKQQVAFNAYPLTLLEKIRSAAKPTTPVSVRVKHNEKPSYKAGYAKSADESASPHLWNGLVGAWMPSLGVTGETLRDVSGNENHGTLTNMDAATDWVATSKGLALDFDGSNDYVPCSRKINPKITGDLTFAVWANFERVSGVQGIMSTISASGNNGQQLEFGRTAGKFMWLQDGTTLDAISTESFSTGDHFVAITRTKVINNWQITFFIDNKPADQHVTSKNPAANGGLGNFTIGRPGDYNGQYFDGIVHSSVVYNRALSPSEIKQLYVDSLAPFRRKAKPIGYQPNKELTGLFKV